MIAPHQGQGQVIEPILIRFAVAVGVNHDFAAGGVHSHVAGVAQAHVALADVADPGKSPQDFLRVVGRSIVHEDHFKVGISQLLHGSEAGFQGAGAA